MNSSRINTTEGRPGKPTAEPTPLRALYKWRPIQGLFRAHSQSYIGELNLERLYAQISQTRSILHQLNLVASQTASWNAQVTHGPHGMEMDWAMVSLFLSSSSFFHNPCTRSFVT